MEKLKDAVCELVSNSEDATTSEHFHELDNMGAEIIDCLDELDKYRAIGTLEELEALKKKDEDTARRELMKIKGVGRKVADCTMLFSLEFNDVYPVDRHIERATREYYPDGLPEFFHPNSGLAQQYIFSRMIER